MTWIPITKELPPDGEVVETKRENDNKCDLKRYGTLWYNAATKQLVSYTPTHWRKKEEKQ